MGLTPIGSLDLYLKKTIIVTVKRQIIWYTKKRVGQEISGIRRIRFRPPTAQLSRAVKADEISVVEPTQPLRLARQSKKIIERLGFLPSPFLVNV